MNAFIEHINHLPCSTLQGLQLSLTQLIPVYIGIACCTYWISGRHVHALMLTLVCFGAATAIRSFDLVQSSNQCKLIVYNIPHHKAIDLVEGNSYVYLGDEGPDMNTQFNFSIKPARQLYRVSDSGRVSGLLFLPNGFYFSNKAVLVISALPISPVNPNCTWDVVILSGNANLRIAQLSKTITTGCLVFDSSNPDWKIKKWVKECERLKLNYYAVPEKGAFILNMN